MLTKYTFPIKKNLESTLENMGSKNPQKKYLFSSWPRGLGPGRGSPRGSGSGPAYTRGSYGSVVVV